MEYSSWPDFYKTVRLRIYFFCVHLDLFNYQQVFLKFSVIIFGANNRTDHKQPNNSPHPIHLRESWFHNCFGCYEWALIGIGRGTVISILFTWVLLFRLNSLSSGLHWIQLEHVLVWCGWNQNLTLHANWKSMFCYHFTPNSIFLFSFLLVVLVFIQACAWRACVL